MNKSRIAVLACLAVSAFAASTQAAPLPLLSSPPDVHARDVGIIYSVTTPATAAHPTMTVSGTTDGLTLPVTGLQSLFSGVSQFLITVTFNKTGSGSAATLVPASATLTVKGKEGSTAGTLQTFFNSPSASAFGFSTNTGTNPSEDFEFLFAAGTAASSVYGTSTTTANVGVIIHAVVPTSYGTGFLDNNLDTTVDSSFFGNSTADIFATPEPASLSLMAFAVAPMLLRRRKA